MEGVILFFVGALTLAAIYGALALALNVEAGWGGLWDLGLAGTLGVGAYVYVLTTLPADLFPEHKVALGWPILAGIAASAIAAGLISLVIGVITLRLHGEYFLITTFAFAEIIRQLFITEVELTGGTVGVNQLARPFDGAVEGGDYRYLLLGIALAALAAMFFVVRRFGRSPFGRMLRALRDNPPSAIAAGKNATRYRILVYVLTGVLIGLIAPLYVWYMRRVVPGLFTPDVTFTVWTALVIGGLASFRGPLVGALLLILAIEATQLPKVPLENAHLLSALRPLLLGLLLIGMLRFLPNGLIPEASAFRRTRRHALGESD